MHCLLLCLRAGSRGASCDQHGNLDPDPASESAREQAWEQLSGLSAQYHHFYDTKLLLLCIPGFALLWSRQSHQRWLALALTFAALIVTGDLSHTVLNRNHIGGWMQSFIPNFPVLLAPITLLTMGVFYLWVFWRTAFASDSQ